MACMYLYSQASVGGRCVYLMYHLVARTLNTVWWNIHSSDFFLRHRSKSILCETLVLKHGVRGEGRELRGGVYSLHFTVVLTWLCLRCWKTFSCGKIAAVMRIPLHYRRHAGMGSSAFPSTTDAMLVWGAVIVCMIQHMYMVSLLIPQEI